MTFIMKLIKYIILVFFITISISSCKKFVEVDPPIDMLNTELVFNSDQTATAAVLGLYSNMMLSSPIITSGAVTFYAGLSADEIYNTNINSPLLSEFTDNALSADNTTLLSDFWLRAYSFIYHANACIVGLDHNTNLSAPVREQLLGEVLLVRSFIYYYMVNLFGDVPLLSGLGYEENGKAPRTPAAEVYTQVISDLKKAQSLLSIEYPSNERVRPNKWTASALLARTYLNLGQWDLAEQEASSIINSGYYSLEPDLANVFLPVSMEAIWQLMPNTPGFNTTEAVYFAPSPSSGTLPNYPLTNYLLNAFEPGDLRRDSWVGSVIVSDETFYYPFKYKIQEYGSPLTEYYMVFRLAEQYLIRAECYAQQEKIDEAQTDLNTVRQRAGLADTPFSTSGELLSAILQERRVELFAEWGHRWLDLKRTKKSTEVLSPVKQDWQATDTLYPIPLDEIRANANLTQNQGY